jgi:glutathione S-transferase
MAYELFYSPGACSLAVHIILEEVGADFELHLVSVVKGDTIREPYLSLNPKGRVPALRIPEESKLLTELPAILLYLARRFPEHHLLPSGDPIREARCLEWLAWLAGWVHGVGFGLIWRPNRFDVDASHSKVLAAQGLQTVTAAYADIENAFKDARSWALGEQYSIVDPFFLVLYRWGHRIGLSMPDHYPFWSAIAQRIVARPAVDRAMRKEGVSIVG